MRGHTVGKRSRRSHTIDDVEDDDSRAISWIQLVAALFALGAVGLLVSMWLLGDGDGGSNAETANVEDTTVLEIPNSEPAAATEPAPNPARRRRALRNCARCTGTAR